MGYFPTTRAALIAWIKNLILRLPTEAAKMNEPVAETTAAVADLQDLLNAYDAADLAIANAKVAVASMLAAEKAIGKKTRSYIQRLKTNPLCTDEPQAILLIAGGSVKKDMSGYTPKIIVVQTGSRLRINFKKKKMHAMNLYGRRGDEASFVFLATITKNPYFDNRSPLKAGVIEMREFYGTAVENNEEVGKPSATVAIAFRS